MANGRSGIDPYTYISPDRKHRYFVQRIMKAPEYYGIYDEQGKRLDSDRPNAAGFDTAEDAQAMLEAKAQLKGWVRMADVL